MNFDNLEKSLKKQTEKYTAKLDIPEFRRDISKPENVRWMLRNLWSKNGEHPNFNLVMVLLTILSEGDKE